MSRAGKNSSPDEFEPKTTVDAPLEGLRIVPLGGLGEIGMNCMVLEYDDEIIVVDCGLLSRTSISSAWNS